MTNASVVDMSLFRKEQCVFDAPFFMEAKAALPLQQVAMLSTVESCTNRPEQVLLKPLLQTLFQAQQTPFDSSQYLGSRNPDGSAMLLLALDTMQESFPRISPMLWNTFGYLVTQPEYTEDEDDESAVHHTSNPYGTQLMRALVLSVAQTTPLQSHLHALWAAEGLLPIINTDTLLCVRVQCSKAIPFPNIAPRDRDHVSDEWFARFLESLYTQMVRRMHDRLMESAHRNVSFEALELVST